MKSKLLRVNPLINKKNLLENIKPYIYNKDNSGFFNQYETARKGFGNILNKPNSENVLQKYLEKHPILFLNAGLKGFFPFASRRCAFFSKIQLGECFETDFAFVHADSTGACWFFIEIERADVELFNKKGDMKPSLSHAIRQITDWQSWIKDNKPYAQSRLDELLKSVGIHKDTEFFVDPKFIIIIGRRPTLNKDTNRRRIEIHNQNPRLEIITYDRLTEPFSFTNDEDELRIE
ncbi:MAG: DUF4263 domain-containing protein [Candidatus Brocadia sp.]|nr:DUF4263 domain-containing protein [Candidatus Brocadia sp.]